ncbi:hypothetical protein [Okeania sp. KiyG1]|uniref:hypothetical protein n=1 Tax=Okeania sp. KiyG1 TaxID=2720165 RepID=UPI001923E0B2|nr:hypothetical protein [Okeania sp. KiyG1]GGA09171.1 hypothetical protein CYANOKiyG1_22060 [Okeania sp. KiyG1]
MFLGKKIQEEKDDAIIARLKEHEPKLGQRGRKEILSLVEKQVSEKNLNSEEDCELSELIKISILPIKLQAILTADEFKNIPEVKGVDENNKKS